MSGTPRPETVSTKQQRLAVRARQMLGKGLTSLSHRIAIDWMCDMYCRTRKDGAVRADGQTVEKYERDLQGNLQSLIDRATFGDAYRASAVRRVYIPKGHGKEKRPISIPRPGDDVVQRSVVLTLERV